MLIRKHCNWGQWCFNHLIVLTSIFHVSNSMHLMLQHFSKIGLNLVLLLCKSCMDETPFSAFSMFASIILCCLSSHLCTTCPIVRPFCWCNKSRMHVRNWRLTLSKCNLLLKHKCFKINVRTSSFKMRKRDSIFVLLFSIIFVLIFCWLTPHHRCLHVIVFILCHSNVFIQMQFGIKSKSSFKCSFSPSVPSAKVLIVIIFTNLLNSLLSVLQNGKIFYLI